MPTSEPAVQLGYWLSSEEHDPRDLVQHARAAERAGFATAMISDHLQPWVPHQGQSSHVWTAIGAIVQATDALRVGTGVTAMIHRGHPVDIAHAMATAAVMSGDRVFLGVGTGERLNEQATGQRWPPIGERRDQLEEAVDLIRQLWSGEQVNHRGECWTTEHIRLWTRPATAPPILVAASGRRSAALAGRIGDGLIGVTPDRTTVEVFRGSGGAGKTCVAQLHVSLAGTMDAAVDQAWEWWPNGVIPPAVLTELSRPEEFEAIAVAVGRDRITDAVVCAVDAAPIVAAIDRFVGAGYDTVYLHQVGPDQDRLIRLAGEELLASVGARS